jgi:uroporphyrinogen decarboxylase
MRQAGRYLPEYQAVRARHSFVDICKTPDLACEVTLQPIRRFGFDAAILFNDILVPLEPAGASFVFADEGPRLKRPVRTEEDVEGLSPFEPREKLGYVAEAIKLIKSELNGTPLIGFAGAPFTLAAYLVEGGGSKNYKHIRKILYGRPGLLRKLLDKLADQVTSYLEMQIDAGADAVQLFDSWAGILTPADYERFVLPGLRSIFTRLEHTGAPRILFVKGGGSYLPLLKGCGADVIGVDWTVDLSEALKHLNGSRVQGNLDPMALFAPPEEIRRRALSICRAGDAASGHVFNLGHGILPETPIEGVETLVQTVKGYRPGEAA